MNTKIYVDPKFGEGVIACNSKTAEFIGKEYLGCKVISDEWIGDGFLACNQTTFDNLQKPVEKQDKVPRKEDKVKEVAKVPPSRKQLKGLNKEDQVKLLLSFGMKRGEIRELRKEKDRIEAILMLQDKR